MRKLIAALLACVAMAGAPAYALGPEDVSFERAYPTIEFVAPLALTSAPGDPDHVYVALQDGRIWRILRDPDTGTAEPFLDIRDRVSQQGGERGLLGLTFDPEYATNGYFYVNYVDQSSPTRLTMISRFQRAADGTVADPASEQVLLSYEQPFGNHKGGWVGIGPDRHLYIASGDGGSRGDPLNNAQRLDSPLGKVLRITRDGAIPENNPFADVPGARGEIWAYGFRNPFRMAFDRSTGELWAADVGQYTWEEIDLVKRGGNYGWHVYEGNHSFDNPDALPPDQFVAPVHEYTRDQGCSVIGGVVYRGSEIPALAGRFIYTDFCSGTVWALRAIDGRLEDNVAIGSVPGNPTSINEDQDGELFVTTLAGEIWRVAPDGVVDDAAFPQLLSQTGLFTDTAALLPAPDLIPYGLAATFWSDGAVKKRWLRLPEGGKVDFTPVGAWGLPVGSATVKHFVIDAPDGTRRRLETRVFRNLDGQGWRGATYRWNAAQTDAEIVRTTTTEQLEVKLPDGTITEQTYEYPAPADCMRCHTRAAGWVLGLQTPQLNLLEPISGTRQLAMLAEAGIFATDIGNPAQYAELARPKDALAPLEQRARAYLHANCSHCHQPGGPTGVDMDLRWTTATAATKTLGVPPTGDDLGIDGAVRIAPGDPERSLVWQRMQRRDANAMPPLGSHIPHEFGVQLIREWIEAGAN